MLSFGLYTLNEGTPVPQERTKVLLACMPKSGSTFLSSVIASLPGFSRVELVPAFGHREQELCILALVNADRIVGDGSYVAQHHVRYSGATEAYINKFSLKPIVLVRNIFDVIPSVIDHHSNESSIYPFAFAPSDIATRSFESQAHFLAQLAVPWYFNFYASWQQCNNKLLVVYDDLIARPESVVKQICAYIGREVTDSQIDLAIRQVNAVGQRRNKVNTGRGKALPSDDIAMIIEMSRHYKDIDFSSIGITEAMRTAPSQ
jgi:hypothetical protein